MRRVGDVTAFYTRRDFMSNHYRCFFYVKGASGRLVQFSSMEQFLMFCKAMLFGDIEIAQKILAEENPQAQKLLGRMVKNYDDAEWVAKREGFYLKGLIARYDQNPGDRDKLMATLGTLLVEASDRDRVWGAGLSEDDDRIADPSQWRGQNLCGKGQMKAREYFLAKYSWLYS